MKEFPLG
jgi:hypothetical protein